MPRGITLDLTYSEHARDRLIEYDSEGADHAIYSYTGGLVMPKTDDFTFPDALANRPPCLEYVDPVTTREALQHYNRPNGARTPAAGDGAPPARVARGPPWYRFPRLAPIYSLPKDLICFRPNIDAPEISESQFSSVDGMQFPNLTAFATFNSIYGFSQHGPKSEAVDMSRDKALIRRSGLVNGMRFKRIETERWLPNERLYIDIPRTEAEYNGVLESMRLLAKNALVPLILKSRRTIENYPESVRRDIVTAMKVWGLAINAAGTYTFARAGNISTEQIQLLAT